MEVKNKNRKNLLVRKANYCLGSYKGLKGCTMLTSEQWSQRVPLGINCYQQGINLFTFLSIFKSWKKAHT